MRSAPLILALAGAALPGLALAHGPAPATLGVPEGASGAPDVLRLATGFAYADPAPGHAARWRFMCPAAWGGDGAPVAVAGEAGVWALGPDGARAWDGASWSDVVALPLGQVRDLVHARGQAWVLVGRDGALALRALDGAAELALDEPWATAAGVERGFALARVDGDEAVVAWVGERGEELARARVDLGVSGASVSLEATGVRLFLSVRQRTGYRLIDVTEDGPGEGDGAARMELFSYGPLGGPVEWRGQTWVVREGELTEVGVDALEALEAPRRYTCLASSGAGPLACSVEGAHVLTGPGGEAEQVFAWSDLYPPRQADVPRGAWPSCLAQWLDLANHQGLDPAPPEDAAPPAPGDEPSAACQSAPGRPVGGGPWWVACLACLVGVRSRSRR